MSLISEVPPEVKQQVIDWYQRKKELQLQIAILDAERKKLDSFKTIGHRLGLKRSVVERLAWQKQPKRRRA